MPPRRLCDLPATPAVVAAPPRDATIVFIGDSVDQVAVSTYCLHVGAAVSGIASAGGNGVASAGGGLVAAAATGALPLVQCTDAARNVTIAYVQFFALHALGDAALARLNTDAPLRALLEPALKAIPAALGGRVPQALVAQSLFHDLEHVATRDAARLLLMAENSTRGDAAWAAFESAWVAAVAAPLARLLVELTAPWQMPFGVAWRTSNRVREVGPGSGWLSLRARVPAANAAAARATRIAGARVLDFEHFQGSSELRDNMHPAYAVQVAFVTELLVNVSRCAAAA
jgi:hypothetical protein